MTPGHAGGSTYRSGVTNSVFTKVQVVGLSVCQHVRWVADEPASTRVQQDLLQRPESALYG